MFKEKNKYFIFPEEIIKKRETYFLEFKRSRIIQWKFEIKKIFSNFKAPNKRRKNVNILQGIS